jgi:hypothetical protein
LAQPRQAFVLNHKVSTNQLKKISFFFSLNNSLYLDSIFKPWLVFESLAVQLAVVVPTANHQTKKLFKQFLKLLK